MSFADHLLVEAYGEDNFVVHLVVHIEDIGHIVQQPILSDQIVEYVGGLLRLAEGEVDLSEQRPGRSERRASRIGGAVRRRQHLLVDDALQIPGDELVHLLFRTAADLQRFGHRYDLARRRYATPEPVHVEVGISSDKERLTFILRLERGVEIRIVDTVEHHVAAIDTVVEVGPCILENAVRRRFAELVQIVAILRTGRRSVEIEIVTAVFAQLGVVADLPL